jgi:hypothetical protein
MKLLLSGSDNTMSIYLHSCLLEKANRPDLGATHSGSDYFHREVSGYRKDGKPSYRYFDTKKEWEAYQSKNKDSKDKGDKGPEGNQRSKKPDSSPSERVEARTKREHSRSTQKVKEKTRDSLFIKSDSAIKKSVYLFIEVNK